jgi:ribonucleoside-diphosphate reductase alpha chain
MQAVLQPLVDNSISKTINVPENTPIDEFRKIYDMAYDMELKGLHNVPLEPSDGCNPE